MSDHPAEERKDEDSTLSDSQEGGTLDDDDVTLPDVDYELLAAFAPPGPSRKTGSNAHHDRGDDARQHSIMAAAEAYALAHREHPREQQQWAEATPAPVRALFRAIRDNTPASRVRDGASPTPYRHDANLPRLEDLSADLRALLEMSWPVWDKLR
jgi:hypothetical protein